MRANSDDHLDAYPARNRFPVVELVLALAVLAGLGALWFYWEDSAKPVPPDPVPAPAVVSRPPPEPELPPTPDIPRQPAPEPETPPTNAVAAQPEPPMEASGPTQPAPLTTAQGEALVREQLAGAEGGLATLAGTEHPLDTTAALIDGFGRGLILRKIVAFNPPAPGFKVQRSGEVIYMDAANYARFDGLAENISALDTAGLAARFHTLRPLYEETYEKLGLDPGDFDNAIIRTLDLVLATPEIDEPIALQTKSVAFIYADPALESLPPLQKQLLRMGPDNLRLIKRQARALRGELLAR